MDQVFRLVLAPSIEHGDLPEKSLNRDIELARNIEQVLCVDLVSPKNAIHRDPEWLGRHEKVSSKACGELLFCLAWSRVEIGVDCPKDRPGQYVEELVR